MHKLNLSSMKKLNLLFVALVGALTFGLSSCTDACKDVVCENSGTCVEGVCDCAAGYEGDLCADAYSDKFLGTYNGSDDCGYEYQSIVTASDAMTMSFSNFAGTNTAAAATVTSTDVTIANQTNGGYTYSATGSISGTTITLDYSLTAGGVTENCTVTYTR